MKPEAFNSTSTPPIPSQTSNEWMQKAGELEAEVERLRLDVDTQTKLKRSAQQDAAKGWAEVERLRKERETHLQYEAPVLARLRRIEEAARLAVPALVLCSENYADHLFEETDVALAALRAALEEGS